MQEQFVSVSQINFYLKSQIQSDSKLKGLYVKGEISNFSRHYKTGHCYFSLKDEKSVIKAVMFNSSASKLPFVPENGMEVIAYADVTVYEAGGVYQLNVTELFPCGEGALSVAFEMLKKKLSAEGLFDEKHKKPIPKIPESIAVITSKKGAALQDILNILRRRFPCVKVVLCPVSVQGITAAKEVTQALIYADNVILPDVIVIARGGGSQEDLSVFNDETLAREIYSCKTPVVSAIGHEVDFTIADFVADLRVPTPSAAAECIVPDSEELKLELKNIENRIYNSINNSIKNHTNTLKNVYAVRIKNSFYRMFESNKQKLDFLYRGLNTASAHFIDKKKNDLRFMCSKLDAVNPIEIISKGYALVHKDAERVVSSKSLNNGDKFVLSFKDGTVKALVLERSDNNDIRGKS